MKRIALCGIERQDRTTHPDMFIMPSKTHIKIELREGPHSKNRG